jgi:hypothetical protein
VSARIALFSLGLLILVALAPAAWAGETETISLQSEASCNDETGEYDLVWSYVNNLPGPSITGIATYRVDDIDQSEDAYPAFAPDPVESGGTAVASASVPGSTSTVFLSVAVSDNAGEEFAESTVELTGDCVAATPTAPAGTATPIPAEPTFTG